MFASKDSPTSPALAASFTWSVNCQLADSVVSGQGWHEEGIILFPSTLALNWFKAAIKAYVHKGEFRVLWKVEEEECLEEGNSFV